MINREKQIKAIISALIENDDARVKQAVNALSESIVEEKSGMIVNAIIETLRGQSDV